MNAAEQPTSDPRAGTETVASPDRSDRPVFMLGCPRSGTSLVSKIVGAHPRIAVPFESHVYHYLWSWAGLYGDLRSDAARRALVRDILSLEDLREWSPRPSLERTLAAVRRPDFHGVFEALLSAWAEDVGKPRWGEKTPQHAWHWKEILAAFPDLQVVWVVRDGRDVALSYGRAVFGPKHPWHLARRWVAYETAGREMEAVLGPDRFLRVRYEDLLDRPEEVVRTTCGYLGESFYPSMLDSWRHDGPYRTDRRNAENLRRGILSGNRGKWRNEMSPRDLRIFEAVASDCLVANGYEPAVDGASLRAIEPTIFRLLEHPPRKLLALARNRKAQRITLQRLRIRWRLLWTRARGKDTNA